MSIDELTQAVAGDVVAIRSRVELKPAGGDGDKVAPPTYAVSDPGANRYAHEDRRVDGEVRKAVLLDSVASQANRLELALLEGWESGELEFPVAYVDFTGSEQLADLGRISVLEAPHRIADALFRDSLLDDTLFRLSDIGMRITESTPRDATWLYVYSPTALLFGIWDSTGPKGGLGAKFQRAITSEIVGFDAEFGQRTASRIDPTGIELGAGPIYKHGDPEQEWTLDPEEAEQDKGKPVLFRRGDGGSGEAGRPSTINHGNVTPSIDARSGGATISHAVQTTVLSLAALRRIRFVHGSDGNLLGGKRREAEVAARTAVAALGLAAIAYQQEQDYDLRSRCLLLPTAPPSLELLRRDGSEPEPVTFDRKLAAEVVREARERAGAAGLAWHGPELRLVPAPKLVELVRRSRRLAAVEGV
jgi:CRISPR-associated protein Csb1